MRTFRVRVKTNQRKESLVVSGDCINVAVKEKPEQGAANKRIITLIATHFSVAQKKVRITRGLRAPSKFVNVST